MKLTIAALPCAILATLALGSSAALAAQTVTADGVTATYSSNIPGPLQQTITIDDGNHPTFTRTWPCAGPCNGHLQITRENPGPRPDVIIQNFAEGGGSSLDIDDYSWTGSPHTWVDSAEAFPQLVISEPTLTAVGGGYSGWVTHGALAGLTIGQSGEGPIVVLRPVDGTLVNQAARFRTAVAADATQWKTRYAAAPATDNVEPLAAWAADESMLHRGTAAWAFLRKQTGLFDGQYGVAMTPQTIASALAADGYPIGG